MKRARIECVVGHRTQAHADSGLATVLVVPEPKEVVPSTAETAPPVNENLNEEEKVCGNIHKPEFRDFWISITEEDRFVRQLIEEGYKLQFETEPELYQEKNNSTAVKEREFVSKAVQEMLEAGVVTVVERDQVKCISPITVASKLNPDGTVKHRFCWDGSRMVNPCLKKMEVRFADLRKSAALVEEGDYMYVYDLKSCYYHVAMHPESKKYLAFEWEGKVYQ